MATLFSRGFASPVPRAGIRTQGGDRVAQCMTSPHDECSGPECQIASVRTHLGRRVHPCTLPGLSVYQCHPISRLAFRQSRSAVYDAMVNSSEGHYHLSKWKLGHVPDRMAIVPDHLLESGFGISRKCGETVGAVVQGSLCDVPLNPHVATSYQTNRGYA
jgi:hypothetical protein